ncbi:MAG: hypothetical protein R3B54_02080 [Bdellovibrionota bacterium]
MQLSIARGTAIAAVALSLFLGTAQARSLKEMERVAQKATSLSAFLSSTPLLEEYKKAVESYYGQSRFNCQNFWEVIDELRALTKRVPAVEESIWRPWHHKNSVLILTPDGHAYNFRSVPRKLHTLWSYATENYCENEVCTNLFVENRNRGTVLLGRWTSTIAGSQVQLIEKDGRYSGMALLLTPFSKDGKTYGLVDAYGDRKTLSAPVKVLHTKSGKPLETTLLNAWLETTSAAKPEWLAGFLVPAVSSSTNGVALAQAFSPRKLRPQMDEGFLPIDPLAGILGKHLAKQCGMSDTVTASLKPSVSNAKGGFFQVVVNGDPSFGKLVVGAGAGGAQPDIFGGEVTPNGVVKNALNAGGGTQNGIAQNGANPAGVNKSNFSSKGNGANSNGNGSSNNNSGAGVASNGSGDSASGFGSGSPGAFGLDPSVHGLGDGLGEGLGASAKNSPSHSKKNSTLPQGFANNSTPAGNPRGVTEPRDPASLPPTGDTAPERTPEIASRDRGVTGEPRQGATPTKPEEKPPVASVPPANPIGENGANSIGDAVQAAGRPDSGNRLGGAGIVGGIGTAAAGSVPDLNPPRREEPRDKPRVGPEPEVPSTPNEPPAEKSPFQQLSEELSRNKEKAKIPGKLFQEAIEEVGGFSPAEKAKAQGVLGEALETANREQLVDALEEVGTTGGQEVAKIVAVEAWLKKSECTPKKKASASEGGE